MNFYKHHIGDYDQATRHLSFVEDAAYCRLMRKCYAEEKPLPADLRQVQRLIGARTREERDAVSSVLAEFFVLESDGWRNKRCDEEISRANAQADANKKVAQAREEKKRLQKANDSNTNRAPLNSTIRGAGEHDSLTGDPAVSITTNADQKTFSEKFPNYRVGSNPANPREMDIVEHESLPSREPSQTPDSRLQTKDLKTKPSSSSSLVVNPEEKKYGVSTPNSPAEWLRHMRSKHGVEIDEGDVHQRRKAWPIFAGWVNAAVTTAQVDAAAAKAISEAKTPIAFLVGYVDRVLASESTPEKKPSSDWRRSDQGIDRKAREMQMQARGGESYPSFADRIQAEIDKRHRSINGANGSHP
jgi:uncharacterized protein YdaU (DUF1376 family)